MPWSCSTCTYSNINASARNCHMCGTERRQPSNDNVVVDLTECSPKAADMESNRSRRRRLEGMMNGQKSRNNDDDNGVKFSSKNDVIDVDLVNNDDDDDDDRHGSDKTRKGINNVALTNNNNTTQSSMAGDDNIIAPLKIKNKSESNRSAMNNYDNGKRKSKSKNKDVATKRSRPLTDFYGQKSTQQQPSLESLMDRATYILQSTFKLTSLRPLQQKAIQGCLSCKSQIVIMATGGGKSLCYQLPALVGGNNFNHQSLNAKNSSVTIVVCPLIALMIDQVNNLMKKGVRTAACWSSSHSAKDKAHIMKRLSIEKTSSSKSSKTTAENNNVDLTPIQILYVTPELIETERFRGVLMKLHDTNRLYKFAIDEAHCLSTWGHDFRPAYRKLSWIRETFPDVPIMACTGTATEQVINDVRSTLSFGKDVPCHLGTFNRQNINYEVRFKDSLNTQPQGAITDLVNEVKKQHAAAERAKQPCAGIIYVHKREDCQSLAMQISKSTGIVAAAYHAGLKDKERDEAQRKWCDGTIKVVVATVAFGMGIDLPHVRYVLHWTMSKSLEGFYQESGRAGRDGLPSKSILYYSKDDASLFTFLIKKNAEREGRKTGQQRDGKAAQKLDRALLEVEGMVDYCIKPGCKRQFVLGHFGEKIDPKHTCKKTCDYCLNPRKVEMAIKASECASAVIMSQKSWNSQRTNFSEKKFHHNPTASDESIGEYESDDGLCFGMEGDDGLLGITSYKSRDDEMISEPAAKKGGFLKASSVLKKYETLECQEGKKGGFINFKTRQVEEPSEDDRVAKRNKPVNIPTHLRQGLPDPHAGSYNKDAKSNEKKSGSFYASENERLKREIEEIERRKAEALAKLGRR